MAVVDTDLKSILNNLKLQDPYYLPPRPWESIPSESGPSDTSSSSTSRTSLYATSSVS
ncbi:hypothetical protein Tco_1280409, partial [Tanacetum coccineum]